MDARLGGRPGLELSNSRELLTLDTGSRVRGGVVEEVVVRIQDNRCWTKM